MLKKLFTSYYARSGKHPDAISISVTVPRWYPRMKHYSYLAPTWDLVRNYKEGLISTSEYTLLYRDLLEDGSWDGAKHIVKTAQQVVDELPEGAVLLCYEKPTDFCHRHVAAKWLMDGANVDVTELPKP